MINTKIFDEYLINRLTKNETDEIEKENKKEIQEMLNTIFRDVAPLILKVAPVIATALGSPAAGAVLELLAKSFNVDGCDDNTAKPEDIAKKIASKNTDVAKTILQQAERDNCTTIECMLANAKSFDIHVVMPDKDDNNNNA